MSESIAKGVLVGLVGLAWAGAASAQDLRPSTALQPPPAGAAMTGVTVTAPKIIERTKFGMLVGEMSLSVHVPFGDLDMRTPAGVAELDRRVNDAAGYACHQLERMYPDGQPNSPQCESDAVHDAQPQVARAHAGR